MTTDEFFFITILIAFDYYIFKDLVGLPDYINNRCKSKIVKILFSLFSYIGAFAYLCVLYYMFNKR